MGLCLSKTKKPEPATELGPTAAPLSTPAAEVPTQANVDSAAAPVQSAPVVNPESEVTPDIQAVETEQQEILETPVVMVAKEDNQQQQQEEEEEKVVDSANETRKETDVSESAVNVTQAVAEEDTRTSEPVAKPAVATADSPTKENAYDEQWIPKECLLDAKNAAAGKPRPVSSHGKKKRKSRK